MMRKIFIVSTVLFWLAVIGLWSASRWSPTTPTATAVVASEKRYTLQEVAQHKEPDDCWMVIGGTVYNLSTYLPQHPSDPAIILPWCGKEATQAYQTKTKGRSHSSYANQLLPQYRIGKLRNLN